MKTVVGIVASVLISCVVLTEGTLHPGLKYPEDVQREEKIVQGSPAEPNQFPHMAYLYIVTTTGWRGCGGSLISPRFIMTAAHCLVRAINITAFLGSVDREDAPLVMYTDVYTYHPEYDEYWAYNDVGLVDLRSDVELSDSIKVIALPRWSQVEETFYGKVATSSGWGWVDDVGPSSQTMNFVKVRIISNKQCTDLFDFGIEMQNFTICSIGAEIQSQGNCNGDSGGALILQDTDGQWMQIGIISFVGNQGCLSDLPNGYARPHYYWPYISSYTGIPIRM